MESGKARAFVLCALAIGGLTLLGAILSLSETGPNVARATHLTPVLTNTPGGPTKTPTPKPDGLGSLSGVYDVVLYAINETNAAYHCVLRMDHDSVTNKLKTASQCYADIDIGDPNGEPLNAPPGEGPDGVWGPPPPAPYSPLPPAKGDGHYDPGSMPGTDDILTLTTCFRDPGGVLGPNAIAVIGATVPKAQLAANGKMSGQVAVYGRQGSAQCEAGAPQGPEAFILSADFHPIVDVNGAGPNSPVPWRTLGDDDLDDDGCSDTDELWTAKGGTANCGDDPYNPLDSTVGSPLDVSGNYALLATAARADACWNGTFGVPPSSCSGGDGTLIPGSYHACLADLQQLGKDLVARIYCYIDSPGTAVNPQAAGAATCPPADAGFCGDGLLGPAPPGRTVKPDGPRNFGDIDDRHTVLAGAVDNGDNSVTLGGCIEDRDGFSALGHAYAQASWNAHTGEGTLILWPSQALADCLNGLPIGSGQAMPLSAVRQATKAAGRDTDSDGCPDKRELSDNENRGGLRDPANHYDYFNPTKDGLNRVDDILAVVNQYFVDDPPGMPDLKSQTDRTGIMGGNPWNLGPPNGQQRVDDILASVKQYFHDC